MSASPQPHVVRLIPQPRGAARFCRRMMDEDVDEETYADFTRTIRDVAARTLDLRKTRPEQDAVMWRNFMRSAKDACPLLVRYEDAWPARCYVQRYLHRGISRHEVQPPSIRPKSKRIALARARLSPQPPYEQAAQRPRSPDASPPPRPPPGAADSVHRAAAPAMSLSQFLRSLNPSLESVSSLLQTSGVWSPAELESVKRWPEAERKAFFKDDVKLNAFQSRSLNLALMQSQA